MHIGVVGATGMVGRKIIEILQEKHIQFDSLTLFASARSAGQEVIVNGQAYTIVELNETNIQKAQCDYVLMSAGGEVSKTYAPIFVQNHGIVIDNSNAWRRDENVPLVVPQVNGELALQNQGIIANPNCSTIQLVTVLNPLIQQLGLERVVVSTYQSVSGAGQNGLKDLQESNAGENLKKFIYPIKDNLIPHIDVFLENGYTKEEDKVIFETRKISGVQDLKITCTAVRVPISFCHGESVNFTTSKPTTVEEIKSILSQAPGVVLKDNIESNEYPMPFEITGSDWTYVGRIREDKSFPNSFNCWIVADNIRRGAAANAVEILAELINQGEQNVK